MLPERTPNSRPWPRISIVMPSYQQGRYIESAIRSILDQEYPNLELFVMDGGSTDESVSVIQRYANRITGWVSEKDRGQSHAINKGLARCTGTLFNWLNSDDRLLPGALEAVGLAWDRDEPDVIVGACDVVEMESRKRLHRFEPKPAQRLSDFFGSGRLVMGQSSTFISTALVREVGGVREDLYCVMDWDLYLRCVAARSPQLKSSALPQVLSELSDHPGTKTQKSAARFRQEAIATLQSLVTTLSDSDRRECCRWLNTLQAQERVARVLEQPAGEQRPHLMALLREHPSLAFRRFYWGAWRHAR